MIRLIGFAAFGLVLATSAQAMSPVPLHQLNGMITQVREACGAGYHMVNGTCIRLPLAGTPPDVQLECIQWVAVALRVEISPETGPRKHKATFKNTALHR